ncbi:hypothetical protein DMH01_02870 [Amycolatopsis sp. WAC 04182]|uniref:hypothetical protein n=1 Tax=Amycolatopsis sp. WAC 04182 TaxID=2203198 RepID=UPI000F7ABADE|nr:hypothetical protein [Amycolatopsis sp. WAC 04182]RSN65348.1 hypothetical protein DMH01_02870 [Amycolatopsis sp. WAC 04182]
MKPLVHNSAKRLAAFCHAIADRLLDIGLANFERYGSMTEWDLIVVRVAFGFLILGNRVERVGR